MNQLQQLVKQSIDWLILKGPSLVFILAGTFIALALIRLLSRRISVLVTRGRLTAEAKKRAETLASVIRHILSAGVWIIALITLLGQLGIEIGPILAAAGIVGLAVGFGAQNLVKDVINGFFILLEDQIRVGDVVKINTEAGVVEKVNLKLTVLRDLAGNVHFIPNGNIGVVTNMTKEYSRYVFDIGVAYRENVDEVIEIIRRIDEELRADPEFGGDILEPIEVLGLDKFADSAVVIRARTKTRPIKQWGIGREFNRRLKKAFDEAGVEIPYPHVTLYMGEDKQGSAPPMHVDLKGGNPDQGGA